VSDSERLPAKGPSPVASPRYIPALDGVRALSVMLVMIAHTINGPVATWCNPGGLGVRIFFVISGYLITGILIDYSDKYRSAGTAAVQFYWRRILRLTPALFVAIVLAALLNIHRMRELWWAHALYLTNFQVALSGKWNAAGHFWSLATEEQFYLAWFPLMVLLKDRGRLRVVIAALMIAVVFRLGIFLPGAAERLPEYICLPFANTDTLAMGSLLTLAQRNPKLRWLFDLFRSWPLMIGSLIVFILGNVAVPGLFVFQVWPPAVALFGACLVRFAIEPEVDWRLKWLTWAPVRHVGKVSYGLYVYHYFVPEAVALVVDFPRKGKLRRVLGVPMIGLAFIIAELSWRFVERPILALKRGPFPAIGYLGERDRDRKTSGDRATVTA